MTFLSLQYPLLKINIASLLSWDFSCTNKTSFSFLRQLEPSSLSGYKSELAEKNERKKERKEARISNTEMFLAPWLRQPFQGKEFITSCRNIRCNNYNDNNEII